MPSSVYTFSPDLILAHSSRTGVSVTTNLGVAGCTFIPRPCQVLLPYEHTITRTTENQKFESILATVDDYKHRVEGGLD
jgi:hypothetical protein